MTNSDQTEQKHFNSVDLAMLSVALFAIVWAVTRACLQSITLDEATTYRAWVAPLEPNQWAPHSNNHLLNSLLMRLATTVFGLSQVSVRLPALAGGCIFISSCYCLCRRTIERKAIRFIVFACLLLNPYLCDFYVAARGYSLGTGFLMGAIATISGLLLRDRDEKSAEAAWMAASGLVGLSFVASFPLAFIDLTTWAALLFWTLAATPRRSAKQLWRLLAASVLPGLLVVAALASWTLLNWPGGELFDGARSLKDTFRTVVSASLFEPNNEIANPLVLAAARSVRPFLLPAISCIAAWQLALVLAGRKWLSREARVRRLLELSLVVSAALVSALAIHWMAFRFFGLLLPRNRTAAFIVPLWTVAVGAVAAIPTPNQRLASIGRGSLIGLLSMLALYYVTCLRTGYFFEWWAWADVKDAYYVLAYYNHSHGVTDVATPDALTDCLEFYRRTSGKETFPEFHISSPLPPGKDVYAMYRSTDHALIAREHLKIVYRGRVDDDLVVAVRPDLDAGQGATATREAKTQ